MGERKGVNKYYPPDYDPNKGGLNKFQGTHALRERARKLHLGILIIRFELPYNIWCEGCENHIGMGVRYNAEKKKAGMYYSTPIYQFRMKCHLCDNHFEMKTDPANLDYIIVTGARRQERRWDPSENEQVAPEDKDVTRKMAADSMFKLEHGVDDKNNSKAATIKLKSLEDFQRSRWEDDYSANAALRQKMRGVRDKEKVQKSKDDKLSLNITLLAPSNEDAKMAQTLKFVHEMGGNTQTKIQATHGSSSKKDIARHALKNIIHSSSKKYPPPNRLNLGIKSRTEIIPDVSNQLQFSDHQKRQNTITEVTETPEISPNNKSNCDCLNNYKKNNFPVDLNATIDCDYQSNLLTLPDSVESDNRLKIDYKRKATQNFDMNELHTEDLQLLKNRSSISSLVSYESSGDD